MSSRTASRAPQVSASPLLPHATHVTDVTRRYTVLWPEVLGRRTQCPEDWLERLLADLTRQRRRSCSAERLSLLAQRDVAERLELEEHVRAGAVALTEEELRGRQVSDRRRLAAVMCVQTGPEDWRRSRQEIGNSPASPTDPHLSAEPTPSVAKINGYPLIVGTIGNERKPGFFVSGAAGGARVCHGDRVVAPTSFQFVNLLQGERLSGTATRRAGCETALFSYPVASTDSSAIGFLLNGSGEIPDRCVC